MAGLWLPCSGPSSTTSCPPPGQKDSRGLCPGVLVGPLAAAPVAGTTFRSLVWQLVRSLESAVPSTRPASGSRKGSVHLGAPVAPLPSPAPHTSLPSWSS